MHHLVDTCFFQCEQSAVGIKPVSSAREKDCAQRNGHGAFRLAVIHICILEGKANTALIYPKSYAECRDSVFDGQLND